MALERGAPDSSRSAAAATRPAVLIQEKTVARGQVVAVDRDLILRGRALSNVVAIRGSVHVSGHVEGDVVVLGGDVFLEQGAQIDGDVFALGGTIQNTGGASIAGRSVAYPTASASWLLLAEGPAVGLSSWSRVVLGAKLALMAAWLVVVLVLLATAAPAVRSTAASVGEEPLRNFIVGLVTILTIFLSVLFFSTFLNALLGVPLLALGLLAALVLKLWGMIAVFCWLGGVVRRSFLRTPTAALQNAIVGLLILGLLKFLPWLGIWAWTAATLVGVGACMTTKFGRHETWLEAA